MRIEGSAAVDIQTQRPVEFRQLTVGVFADQAIIAHYLADNCSILLFYKTLIVFQRGTSARE